MAKEVECIHITAREADSDRLPFVDARNELKELAGGHPISVLIPGKIRPIIDAALAERDCRVDLDADDNPELDRLVAVLKDQPIDVTVDGIQVCMLVDSTTLFK